MKNIKIFLVVIFTGFLSGCEKDFLDTQLQQNFDEDLFLNSGFDNLKALGMGVYDYLPHHNGYGGNAMLAAASDEADFARPTAIQRFNTGAWGPFLNPDNVLGEYYRGIRHANLFLDKTTGFKTLIVRDTINNKANYLNDVDDFTKLRAEVRFLRAYYYLELIKRYGGVPLVTTVLTEETAKGLARNSFQEVVDFIVKECDEVYPVLTNHYVNYGGAAAGNPGQGDTPGSTDVSRIGRVEKPAALALKLRALLYAASPLHNPANELQKWERAAAAGQQLFSDPNSAHVRFLSASFTNLFQSQNTTNNLTPRKGANSGIILTRPFERNGSTFERANYPVGMTNGGQGVTAPSQNLVDAFEMKFASAADPRNGKPISDPASGYLPSNPYANRDPRLGFTVVLNNTIMGKNTNGSNRTVQAYTGGLDGIGAKAGATTTGYYLKKGVVDNFDLTKGDARPKAWVLMRYAEVLLNFAEAMNEAYGPEARPALNGVPASMSAREAVNMVRARPGVGMPAIPAGLSQAEFRERLRNERRVELAFEEHRFFDVRRWKIAEVTENQPLRGMRINRDGAGNFTYEPFVVEQRNFLAPQMYLYPFPSDEIAKSGGSLVQNPGW